MRYQNWDVLLFPGNSLVPIPEYKTACHVVHDSETLNLRNSVSLLPTVTSFIPALPAGESFRVSIHAWDIPQPSRYAHTLTKQPDLILFEARVLVDGRLTGARVFGREGLWPVAIETSLRMDKNGEMESLKFPVFHREMLSQSYWNAGDELGRIKVVIAEGCSRDPLSTTFDRIKNTVAFSFQHAPLDILEASAIAWPNAAMWRQVSFNASYLPQYVSPRAMGTTAAETHSHSPRPKASLGHPTLPPPALGPMLPPGVPTFLRAGAADPFTEPMHPWRQGSSADVSMPDYSSAASWASHSRRATDPVMNDRSDRRYDTIQGLGAFESICEALLPSAPDNTPQDNDTEQPGTDSPVQYTPASEMDYFPIKYEESVPNPMPILTSSIAGIKGRKENVHEYPGKCDELGTVDRSRRGIQASMSTSTGGAKRQRVITTAAFKVIDEEDEPRSSPTRKISQATSAQEGDRKVLGGIEPNIF